MNDWVLSATFGLPLSVTYDDGRYYARRRGRHG
jgi:hypothetical protein